jgi:hypothetical protein
VVRSKNNILKGKGKFHIGNRGRTKKHEPISLLLFEGHYNTEWVLNAISFYRKELIGGTSMCKVNKYL